MPKAATAAPIPAPVAAQGWAYDEAAQHEQVDVGVQLTDRKGGIPEKKVRAKLPAPPRPPLTSPKKPPPGVQIAVEHEAAGQHAGQRAQAGAIPDKAQMVAGGVGEVVVAVADEVAEVAALSTRHEEAGEVAAASALSTRHDEQEVLDVPEVPAGDVAAEKWQRDAADQWAGWSWTASGWRTWC